MNPALARLAENQPALANEIAAELDAVRRDGAMPRTRSIQPPLPATAESLLENNPILADAYRSDPEKTLELIDRLRQALN